MAGTIKRGLSNLCLDERTVALGGVNEHVDALGQIQGDDPNAGYPDGFCVTPTRALAKDLVRHIEAGTFSNDIGGGRVFASGIEQSWGPGLPAGLQQAGRQVLSPKAALTTVALSSVMPESIDSLDIMQALDDALGHPLAVVRAEIPGRKGKLVNFTPYGFRRAGVQLKPGVYRILAGVLPDKEGWIRPTPNDHARLHRALRAQGVGGLILDCHWAQAEDEQSPGVRLHPSAYRSAGGFWSPTSESEAGIPLLGLHFAVGRTDSKNKGDRERSMSELDAVLTGPQAIGQTALGQIMAKGYEVWRYQLRREWLGLNQTLYDKACEVAKTSPNQLVTRFSAAAQTKQMMERVMLDIQSPAQLPVDVEVTARGLQQYREAQGKRWARKDVPHMLQEIAYNVDAFFDDLEAENGDDDTQTYAVKTLTGIEASRPVN